jgi:hypothetical protein
MKKLFSLVMLLSALTLFAQPAIKFDSMTIDFGTIKEEDGKVTKKFEFTNTGNEDLILTGVKPSCGCTAADYTKTPVSPGQKGFISATYNPYNHPGSFNKNIKVTTNEPKFQEDANTSPHMIYIKGYVEKRAPSKYDVAGYTNGTGDLRIKDNNVKIDLLSSESKSFTINVMNFSAKPSVFAPTNLPSFIIMNRDVAATIMPGEEVEISFKYDAAKRNEIGNYKDFVHFQTSDTIEPKISLIIESTIKEDFTKLSSKQLQDAPKAIIDSLTVNFGKVEKNTNPTKTIRLYNKGKNPLIIRQLKSPTTVFAIVTDKTEIAKDDFATLTITLNSKNRRGSQNYMIEIITNDPANSSIILNCKGELLQ